MTIPTTEITEHLRQQQDPQRVERHALRKEREVATAITYGLDHYLDVLEVHARQGIMDRVAASLPVEDAKRLAREIMDAAHRAEQRQAFIQQLTREAKA